MTDGQYKRLEAQFNEGILLGVQAATGKMIELLQLNPSWTTPRATSWVSMPPWTTSSGNGLPRTKKRVSGICC